MLRRLSGDSAGEKYYAAALTELAQAFLFDEKVREQAERTTCSELAVHLAPWELVPGALQMRGNMAAYAGDHAAARDGFTARVGCHGYGCKYKFLAPLPTRRGARCPHYRRGPRHAAATAESFTECCVALIERAESQGERAGAHGGAGRQQNGRHQQPYGASSSGPVNLARGRQRVVSTQCLDLGEVRRLVDGADAARAQLLPVLLPLTPDDYPRMAEMKAFVALADKWRSLIAGDEGPVMGGFPFGRGDTGFDRMASGGSSWGGGAGESVCQTGAGRICRGFLAAMQMCWCCEAFVPMQPASLRAVPRRGVLFARICQKAGGLEGGAQLRASARRWQHRRSPAWQLLFVY
eukprot:jgi/Mesvir1/13873/Mv16013-RA.1